ncbi:NlpC/P60 family protein [Actinomadura vinacea]
MFAIFGGSGIAFVATFLVLVMLAVMTSTSGSGILQACAPNNPTGGSGVVQAKATKAADSIPENYLKLYKEIGEKRNIPWNVLAGIGYIETHHGTLDAQGVTSGENYAGAGGPMQFLKSSWDIYGADGDGDGKEDRYNPADAIAGAANHLRGSIGKMSSSIPLSQSDIRRAVHRYNPGNYTPQNNPYANDVLAAANRYAKGYKVATANYASATCAGPASLGSGSFGQKIAYAAAYWARADPGTPRPPTQKDAKKGGAPTPYSWGGGTPNGPDTGICCSPNGASGTNVVGFDCSSLALYAVYQASGKKITIPRTTWAIWRSNKGLTKVPRNQLAPGDLVFFSNLSHMGIYYGEVNGVRWMVEAPKPGDYVKFSKFDGRGSYVGALRVTPPSGSGKPDVIQAMAPSGAGTGGGAA